MSDLAILGGRPVRVKSWPRYNPIGIEEQHAVQRVLSSGLLSGFVASDGPEFYGGPEVFALEKEWSDYFGIKHSIAMNSATSCLYAAMGAIGIQPGDEVIVPPFTMSASVTAVLVYGGFPVFADVEPDYFCIHPERIAEKINPRTKAIVAVDLFGQPADMREIMRLALEHGLMVIEDAAQAPSATLDGELAGTLGHIGIFSLNQHKIIHCGEGGVAVTGNDRLAERMRLVRNHGEVVLQGRPLRIVQGDENLIGYNYRMTELCAAVARKQLKKLDDFVKERARIASVLTDGLGGLPGLTLPEVRPGASHVYWRYAFKCGNAQVGIERIAAALRAEGIPAAEGYVAPIYRQPIYRSRQIESCPITEWLSSSALLLGDYCSALLLDDVQDVIDAYRKVLLNAKDLCP